MEGGAEWEWASIHFGVWRFHFALFRSILLNNQALEQSSIAKARVSINKS
jgi:hypothetical protein